MIAPIGAPSFHEALRAGAGIYSALRDQLDRLGFATALGDEGGFAPALQAATDVLDLLMAAIEVAGYQPGLDGVAIALDLAASGFEEPGGGYLLNGQHVDTVQLIDHIEHLVDHYPIWSVEDGVGEDDQRGWELLTQRLGGRIQIVGDDNLVTNPAIIAEAISRRDANAALIKVNQVGTVTETLAAVDLCRQAGYGAMVSHPAWRDRRRLHRRPGRRHRVRADQGRGPCPRRAGSQVQPAPGHRGIRTGTSLRLAPAMVSLRLRGMLLCRRNSGVAPNRPTQRGGPKAARLSGDV